MRATRRPDREEYPSQSADDFATAIRRALDEDRGDKFTHHRVGRYTATQTYTEHEPDARPGDKVCVVRVTECERETIADIPVEHAESVLAVVGDDPRGEE